MRWQWKLGTFAGIDVFVHATFLLLIGWVGYSYWLQHGTLAKVIEGILFILALFLCVVLHEYGHALTARRYGIKTRDITLYPIGGVARLERMPDKPIEELWVALMGPAVNLVIAAVLFTILYLSGSPTPMTDLTITSGSFLARLMTGWWARAPCVACNAPGIRARYPGRCECRPGTCVPLRLYWSVQQSLPAFYCFLCMDRCLAGSQYGADEKLP